MSDENKDWIELKEDVCVLIEEYIEDNSKEEELIGLIRKLSEMNEFKYRELFKSIFKELMDYLPELSDKELRQRVKMMRGYLE